MFRMDVVTRTCGLAGSEIASPMRPRRSHQRPPAVEYHDQMDSSRACPPVWEEIPIDPGDVSTRFERRSKALSNSTAETGPAARRGPWRARTARRQIRARLEDLEVGSMRGHERNERPERLTKNQATDAPGSRGQSPGLRSSPARESRDDRRAGAIAREQEDCRSRCPGCRRSRRSEV